MNKILKTVKKQIKTFTDNSLELHFCTHLLALIFYINNKLNDKPISIADLKPDFIKKLINILNSPTPIDGAKLFDELSFEEMQWLNKNVYLFDLYVEIFKLHLHAVPFQYFYEKKYDVEQDKKSIILMEKILAKISLFNNECIKILINKYAEIIKFAKLSWMDIKKHVKY